MCLLLACALIALAPAAAACDPLAIGSIGRRCDDATSGTYAYLDDSGDALVYSVCAGWG